MTAYGASRPGNGSALADWLTRSWHIWLVVLALLLPFELREPWFDLRGGLAFTNLELAALLALALWLARCAALREWPDWRSLGPLAPAIAVMLLSLLLASFFAPSENGHALKVTARWAAGAAVCWMFAAAVQSGLRVSRVLLAVAISGTLAALLVLSESAGAGGGWLVQFLGAFRIEPSFRVGGELRPSGPLAYPTIASAYLEFAFCFAAGAVALRQSANRRLQTGSLAVLLLCISAALIATLTRSALAALALAAVFVLGLRWWLGRRDALPRIFLAGLLSMGLMLGASALALPALFLRLSSATEAGWYRAAYAVTPLPALDAGQRVEVALTLSNTGQRTWETGGANGTFLTYHWLSADGKQIVGGDDVRTPLPHDVAPGESIALTVGLVAPARAGDYLLAWDMLRNDLFYFSVLGAPMYEMPVQVGPSPGFTPGGGAGAGRDPSPGSGPDAGAHSPEATPTPMQPAVPNVLRTLNIDRPILWGAAIKMLTAHPLLGVGPGNFRLVLGQYLGVPEWDTRLHANNMYLEQFADAGLLGGIAFLMLCLLVARAGWQALRISASRPEPGEGSRPAPAPPPGVKPGEGPADKTILVAVLCTALAAFFIHGLTDYFLEFTPMYLTFWLTTGLLLGLASLP